MSPAAADFRPPITSPLSKPSSHPQNPKPSSDESLSSNPFNFNALGSDGPNVQTRSRPRLVKHRKHHARSRTGPTEPGPELKNPFRSVSGGGGFVFGAKLSGIGERAEVNSGDGDLNVLESVSAKQGSSSNVGDSEYCENGRSDSGVGFVFGSSWVHDEGSFAFGSATQDDAQKGESAECVENLGDPRSSSNVCEVKPSDEDLGDCKSNSNSLNDKLSFDFSTRCKLVSENCEVTDADSHKSTHHVVFGSESNTAGTTGAEGFGVCFQDFNTPLRFSSCLKENLFPEMNKSNIGVKGRSSVRDKRSRKTRAKLKKPSLSKQCPAQHKESSCQETPVSPGCCSPMDFSPYRETIVVDPHSRESSNGSIHLGSNTIGPNGDEGEMAAQGDRVNGKAIDENSGERIFDGPSKGSGSGAETPCFSSKNEHANGISHAGKDSLHVRADIGLNVENQERDCGTQCFASGFENMTRTFTFAASSSAERSPIVARRLLRRVKNKKKVGCNSFVITPSPNVEFGADQSAPYPSTSLSSDVIEKSEPHEQFMKVHVPSTDATHETCEKWRIRGNEAYRNKDFSKAEDFYTQGIVSVPSSEGSGSCLKPLLLCYSNRAATRMYMGKIREALGDCMMATGLDPNFLKVQMRAANCHLLLGKVENAQRYFNNCLESRPGVCLDRRIVIDSADGVQKAQKVAEYMNHSAKLLEEKTTDAALSALKIVSEALSISEYSEKLLEMKAEALCLLRRYEEAIQLCEHSMYFAEKNFSSLNSVVNMDGAGCEGHPYARLWRWFFISKSYFHLGRLEAALNLLEKLEQVGSIKDRYASKILDSSISLAVIIRELLRHKDAGNEAFRSGKHTEAVEHYTVALSRNIGSRPFSAICLCNRAAAHQALGQITDAIADCSLAIALDGNYAKAVSRRVTLHEMIQDYRQASIDLRRLISVLENQSGDKAKEANSQGSSTGRTQELRNAYRRMPLMEEEAKKGIPLNFYLILGIKPSDSSPDIKKAYRKAALKHHPDKAGQFLARSESGDEGQLWKEISLEVHKDADRLFKMIGEAYAVLSDPNKRSEYDLEEDVRKSAMESKDRGIYRKSSDVQNPRRSSNRKTDFYSSPFERSSYYRNCRESWKTYGDSFS